MKKNKIILTLSLVFGACLVSLFDHSLNAQGFILSGPTEDERIEADAKMISIDTARSDFMKYTRDAGWKWDRIRSFNVKDEIKKLEIAGTLHEIAKMLDDKSLEKNAESLRQKSLARLKDIGEIAIPDMIDSYLRSLVEFHRPLTIKGINGDDVLALQKSTENALNETQKAIVSFGDPALSYLHSIRLRSRPMGYRNHSNVIQEMIDAITSPKKSSAQGC